MTYSDKEMPIVSKILKEYGVDASGASIEEVIDDALYNETFLINVANERYFIVADVVLSDDDAYLEDLKAYGAVGLEPLKLLEPGPDGEYITMVDDEMICKVFKIKSIAA